MSDDAEYQATERGVRDAWDFWLSQHDVSVPATIEVVVKDAVDAWLDRYGEDLFTAAVEKVAKENMPTTEQIVAILRSGRP
jgi:hypothetical protein